MQSSWSLDNVFIVRVDVVDKLLQCLKQLDWSDGLADHKNTHALGGTERSRHFGGLLEAGQEDNDRCDVALGKRIGCNKWQALLEHRLLFVQ